MARGKLEKFRELKELDNVIEHDQENAQANLVERLESAKRVTVELGCGRGEYTVALAQQAPEELFIGVDIQGERIWHGAKQAVETGLENILFVRMKIEDLMKIFPDNTIDEIWLTFPDPFSRDRQAKKRLLHPRFLMQYQHVLKPDGIVNLKTDSDELFEYTSEVLGVLKAEVLNKIENIYEEEVPMDVIRIPTRFEHKHVSNGKSIKYLRFRLPQTPVNPRIGDGL